MQRNAVPTELPPGLVGAPKQDSSEILFHDSQLYFRRPSSLSDHRLGSPEADKVTPAQESTRVPNVATASKEELLQYLADKPMPEPRQYKPVAKATEDLVYEALPGMACLGLVPGKPHGDSTLHCLWRKYMPVWNSL
ncbi:MAG: hypothetical protein SFV17_23285 [Candidatus Obscuribacter sp.]|nr:hypothetical protein [Candidatus Melainabacteria bacterium]MDX1989633.1 hypothetical protein [Candidatus Obscuribacter sp.]